MRSVSRHWLIMCSIALLLSASILLAQETRAPKETSKAASVAGLKINLSTNKSVYRPGEEVRVVITVENVSDISAENPAESCVYVDNQLLLGYTDTGASLDVSVFDEQGNNMPHHPLVADAFGVPDNIVQVIATRYLPLWPGNFLGLKTPLYREAYEPLTRPGRYKLVAEYSNGVHRWLTKEQLEKLEKLTCRVWTGPAKSEPVWIEVRK